MAERRYQGARDWRRVGLQTATDHVDRQPCPGGGQRQGKALFYGFELPRGTTFDSTLSLGVPSAWVANISLQIQTPCRGESFVSLLCPTLAIPHHCYFSFTQTQAQTNRGSRHHFSNLKDGCPTIFDSPPLSLSLSAPTFRHFQHFWAIMSKFKDPKVGFFFHFFTLN
jgi:hypothetical protein